MSEATTYLPALQGPTHLSSVLWTRAPPDPGLPCAGDISAGKRSFMLPLSQPLFPEEIHVPTVQNKILGIPLSYVA